MVRWSILVAVLLLSSCTSYEPRPIDPGKAEAEFRDRTLSDPAFGTYMKSKMPDKPPSFPPAQWDLESLTWAAFYFHPDLDVARARLAISEAGMITARARPNPTLVLSPEYAAGAASGVMPWILGLSLDVPVETAGKRGYRVDRTEKLNEAARLGLSEAGWHVRSRLRAAFLDHLLALRELDLAVAEENLRSEEVKLIERRRSVGEVSRLDVDTAHVELTIARQALRAAEGRLAESRVALADSVGVPISALSGLTLARNQMDSLPDGTLLTYQAVRRVSLLNRLDLHRLLVEYATAEVEIQQEVAKQYPDVVLSPGYKYDQSDNKFSFGLSFTLPLFDRHEGPIAEARARCEEVAARFMQLQANVIAEIESTWARYHSAFAEFSEAEVRVADLARLEKDTARQFELGEVDRLALIAIRLRKTDAARTRLDALRKTQKALGNLEDAVQRPLGPKDVMLEPSLFNPREK